jgi:hypothetical protein
MGDALDAAWEDIHRAGHRPPVRGVLPVREAMAKRIIAAARAGERDVTRLREAALSALPNLRVPI